MKTQLPNDITSYIAPAKKIDGQVFEPTKVLDEKPLAEVGFASGGNPDVPCPTCEVRLADGSDNPNCFAKKITLDTQRGLVDKFFVKIGLDGFMFDPWGAMSEGSQNRYARLHGRPVWKFSEVNRRAFEFYKTFLQTRNKTWKINAEREVANGSTVN